MKKLIKQFIQATSDESFRHLIENVEVVVSKLLSLLMLIVIFAALADLAIFIAKEILSPSDGSFSQNLFKVFGLFLNVLIALEILENINGYLKKHVLQVELVIVTSLIAIARKIIILDLKVTEGIEIIGLGIAILALSISYFIIRSSNNSSKEN
ncbi:phosphate-starvation-inducible PsiE family protein [Anabaena azotica]|uniref:phosphate-starvation-inducible PsiE family protein n=1 Tax=Anabaena azotica TaxID=197653 RepID=UPI0039A6352D